MNVTGVLETGIYVDDVVRSTEFYQRVFGFEQLVGDDRFCALSVAGRKVVLIFKKGGTNWLDDYVGDPDSTFL